MPHHETVNRVLFFTSSFLYNQSARKNTNGASVNIPVRATRPVQSAFLRYARKCWSTMTILKTIESTLCRPTSIGAIRRLATFMPSV
jgi:hypothetical protein